MERKGIAKFLTTYLDSDSELRVLNINSPWGTGKTFFLVNWREELQQTRACVYFNAWENDYSGDPFISLSAALYDQLSTLLPATTKAANHIQDFRKKASHAIVAVSPTLAKGLVKAVTRIDIDSLSETLEKLELDSVAEKAVEHLIENNKKTAESVSQFKSVLTNMCVLASEKRAADSQTTPAPVYIFIDELDRCRPTFAVELLERIKHFFDVQNCKFIVATDTQQLSCSVNAIYGESFDSRKYLKRFFDAEFTLDNSNITAWIASETSELPLENYETNGVQATLVNMNYWRGVHEPCKPSNNALLSTDGVLGDAQLCILAIALTFKTKLRELKKCFRHIRAIEKNLPTEKFDIFWAAYLALLKDCEPTFFENLTNENDSSILEQIRNKYPARMLYYGTNNQDVHHTASSYFDYFHSTKKDLAKKLDSRPNSPQREVLDRFIDHYEVMRSYPRLVCLAHNIS